ncbi:MAG: ComEC/Rec2 family competence protein, partial [Clostridia bacterium]|nr:ComEC/Rec2 family competence protein [Clostridia bacterium]
AFVRKFMRALTLTKYISIPISVLVVLFYIVMTGGSYSVMRAGIMAITGFGAFLLLMRRDILNSVAIAVTVILMYEPYAVKSLSFQLSCGAVIGIAVFALPVMKYIRKRLEKYLCSKKRYIRFLSNTLFTMLTSVTVTFSVLFFTFPTTLYYAGDILPVSFFSNIVIIPLTAPVMIVLITYIILYFIPLFPVRMIAEKIVASAADIMLGFFEKTAEFFAGMDIPMINLSQMAYSVFAVSVAVAFSVLILTKARIRRYNAVFCIVSAVCIMLFVSDSFHKNAEVHFLSEDYSSCTIFKQDKKTVVCAGGNDFSYAVVSYCDKYLNDSVDAVIIPPQCGDCISSFDIIYAEGIDVESIYVYDEDENAAKIKVLLGTVFPDTKIYKYKTGQPFLDGFAIRADGALEKEIFSKRFVLCNADNEPFGDLGDISVAYYGKDGKVFEHGIKTHDITYCKTHIFNITDSKITMRCYG